MAKRTLLNMVQNILSAMSSDAVNNIDDTEEAVQVSEIIRETYEELMALRDWPHLQSIGQLESVADDAMPMLLRIPEDVDDVYWIKYNKGIEAIGGEMALADVEYITPKEMHSHLSQRRTTAEFVTEFSSPKFYDGVRFNIINNAPPNFWTSFDNEYIMFDSYESGRECTMHGNASSFGGLWGTKWRASNTFVPDLPSKMFPMLLAESKEVAMLNLRQVANGKEAARSRRQQNTMQHRSYRQNGKQGWIAYGKRR